MADDFRIAEHHDDEAPTNPTNNPHITNLIPMMLSRRQALQSMAGVAAVGALGTAGGALANYTRKPGRAGKGLELGFGAVQKSTADVLTLPEGYEWRVLLGAGDPITEGISEWAGDGSESALSYDHRAGEHHDGMAFFPLNRGGNPNKNGNGGGLLCLNHEALTQPYPVHPNGETIVNGVRTVVEEVQKEFRTHGVTVVELHTRNGRIDVNRGSRYNRRITTLTEMELSGPIRGNDLMKTLYSPDCTRTRGTVNNCAHGVTPWGTYLTCEENWAGYFARGNDADLRSEKENIGLARYGRGPGNRSRHRWDTTGPEDEYQRWDITVKGSDATGDYRNAANTYGWVVEVDPFDPNSTPKKRSTMGRLGHEGAWNAICRAGEPVVFYTGDDSRNEYIYKFVSDAVYSPSDKGLAAGDKYLDSGRLYVAKFDADGSGEWVELSFGVNGLDENNPVYSFADQADVLTHCRLAGDFVGATRMDRPEWGAVNPANGEVYFALTNNSQRTPDATDAANPRSYERDNGQPGPNNGNDNGHIIRWRERGGKPDATRFDWDIYVFGSRATYGPETNLSALNDDNDFSSPDGLWFDYRGVLWVQTDDGAYADTTNCMMLAAIPGELGDGMVTAASGTVTVKGANPTVETLRRFLVGPKGCEITGVELTPDGKAMFVNIQHPGEDGTRQDPQSTWPDGPGTVARSATVVITRQDGGAIGLV